MKMKVDLPERTFEFARRVVNLCKFLDNKRAISKLLANQLFRSGTSIGANVEEAQAAQSKADFVHKYSIANKEARETLYWLKLLRVSEIIKAEKISGLEEECNELIAILTAIIKKTDVKK